MTGCCGGVDETYYSRLPLERPETSPLTIAVVGASGFVGGAVVEAAQVKGHFVLPLKAPRLPPMTPAETEPFIRSARSLRDDLRSLFAGVDVVINAAGISHASSRDVGNLTAANACLPGLIASVAAAEGQVRLVHVSTAAVQGRQSPLDESETYRPFSPYSRSKVLGEELVRKFGNGRTVIYRPPGVHAANRLATRDLANFAASPFRSVARPGDAPSPQAQICNVADALVFLATHPQDPPPIVLHPWEGMTARSLLEQLGGQTPHGLPRALARTFTSAFVVAGIVAAPIAPYARRLEVLWFGQTQATSWLTSTAWRPKSGESAWQEMGLTIRQKGVRHARLKRRAGR